jgi:transposase-like protein
MAVKRKVPTAAVKTRVAPAAHEGVRTVKELAGHHGVHPELIQAGKKQLVGSEDVKGFRPGRGRQAHPGDARSHASESVPGGRGERVSGG